MATLRFLNGPRANQAYPINNQTVVFGRHRDCDVVLPSLAASRRHAQIIHDGAAFFVEDLGSCNGTFLNGRHIETRTRLHDRDWIEIDDVIIEFADAVSGDSSSEDSSMTKHMQRPQRVRRRPSLRTEAPWSEDVTAVNIMTIGSLSAQASPQVQLQAVLEITRDLGASLDSERLLQSILGTVFRIFPHTARGHILQIDETSGKLTPVVSKQRGPESDCGITFGPVSQSLVTHVIKQRKAILSGERLQAADLQSVIAEDPLSIMCAPMIGHSQDFLGVIHVEADDPNHRFASEDLDLLACLAVLAAHSVEHSRTHHKWYRAVVDTALDGILTCDGQGMVRSANPASERMFGYERGQLAGRCVSALFDGGPTKSQLHPHFPFPRTKSAESGRPGGEVQGRRKDGSSFPMELSVGEFVLDDQQHFTVICHDVTAWKQAERQLRELNVSLEQRVAERTRYVQLLQDVAVIANGAESVPEALRFAVQTICRRLHWLAGGAFLTTDRASREPALVAVWVGDSANTGAEVTRGLATSRVPTGSGLVGDVIATGQSTWTVQVAGATTFAQMPDTVRKGAASAVAFPILIGCNVCGALEFFTRDTVEPAEELLQVMSNVGTQLGRVIERRQLQQELVDTVWEQQRLIGQELHDTFGQELTGIRMMAETLERKLEVLSLPEATKASELAELIQDVHSRMQQLSKGMFPVDVFEQGLMAALHDLTESVREQCGIACEFICRRPVDVHECEVATHLFRIAQEAANNAVKHSQCDRIEISLSAHGNRLALKIADNGTGIADADDKPSGGMGMRIMKYRARVIGGTLTVIRPRNGGTAVTCTVEQRMPDGLPAN